MADEGSDAGNAVGNDDLLAQAMLALDEGRAADAVRLASGVLEADPRHAGALYALGYALTVQGRYDEAVKSPKEAARMVNAFLGGRLDERAMAAGVGIEKKMIST